MSKGKTDVYSSDLRDELLALKGDVSRLLNTTSEGIFDASKSHAEALADQIKAALNDLSETLSEQEDHAREHHIGSPDRVACFGVRARRRRRLHAEETLR